MKKVPNINKVNVSVHCHNDLGLAVANSVAAVQNGARQVECTINGIGERAGNASLEEFVMALHTRRDLLNLTTNVKTEEIFKTSRLLSSITGIFVQPNKAIVGKNAFAHEAGIHQDGIIKEPLTYEIMTPESVGIKERALIVGKHSGRHALQKRYEEMGYQLSKEELDRIYSLFKKLADKKKTVFDEDLVALLHDERSVVPKTFSLEYIQTISGPVPTATVRLSKEGKGITDSATGDGPVDATYRAIDRITKIQGTLLDYSISSVSRGKDAIGEVFVRVVFEDNYVVGKAASTDVIEASAKAYLNALNKAIYSRKPKAKRE
jgi:2-isopropylmalate synthase